MPRAMRVKDGDPTLPSRFRAPAVWPLFAGLTLSLETRLATERPFSAAREHDKSSSGVGRPFLSRKRKRFLVLYLGNLAPVGLA